MHAGFFYRRRQSVAVARMDATYGAPNLPVVALFACFTLKYCDECVSVCLSVCLFVRSRISMSSAVAEMGDRLAAIDMGRKNGGLLCSFL